MKRTASLAIAGLLMAALTVAPAGAQGHSANQDGQDVGQAAREEAQQRRDSAQEETEQRQQAAREEAQQRRERIQQETKERRAEVKQQVCERKQEQLQQIIPRLATQSRALKDAMDQVYENVQGFIESEQVVVDDYEEHKSSVDAAQADAEAAVQVVENYEFELDCEDPNVGQQLDGFRTAVEEARQELTEYRDELVELIQAMRAEEANNADENRQENDSEENQEDNADNAADEGVENAQ